MHLTLEDFKKRPVIYVDLDMVLVDFEKGFKAISDGVGREEYLEMYGHDTLWALVNTGGVAFWDNLDWMPDGKRLWAYLAPMEPQILSSCSTRNTGKTAIAGKKSWCARELGPNVVVNLSRSSKDKQNYCSPGDILVDDLKRNIDEWEAKGGIGVHHTDASSSIEKLLSLF